MSTKRLILMLIFASIVTDFEIAKAVHLTCGDAFLAKDYATAFTLCESEIKRNEAIDGWSQYYLSIMYRRGDGVKQDASEGYIWALRSAKQGNLTSMFLVATDYVFGNGVPQNDSLALAWIVRLVKLDLKEAESLLAWLYDTGKVVTKSPTSAAKWCLLAAQQGDPDAQLRLSAKYWGGVGVPQDYVEAHRWANLARAQGHMLPSQYFEELVKLMTPNQIEEAQKLAREWTPRQQDPKAVVPLIAPLLFDRR